MKLSHITSKAKKFPYCVQVCLLYFAQKQTPILICHRLQYTPMQPRSTCWVSKQYIWCAIIKCADSVKISCDLVETRLLRLVTSLSSLVSKSSGDSSTPGERPWMIILWSCTKRKGGRVSYSTIVQSKQLLMQGYDLYNHIHVCVTSQFTHSTLVNHAMWLPRYGAQTSVVWLCKLWNFTYMNNHHQQLSHCTIVE